MEMWLPLAGIVIAFSALWWKITTSLVTKDDLKEMRRQINDRFSQIDVRFAQIDERFVRIENDIRHDISGIKNDIRELRQLWTTHLAEHH